MKYVVTECHDGYAVLMDEGAGFVHAANLHYKVGQTVTNPLLMQETEQETKRITVKRILPVLGAAACLVAVSAAGLTYYAGKYKTHSVVVMSSDANIKMYLNKQGEVLSLQGEDEYAAEILKDYDGKLKNKIEVANDLLAKQIEGGHLTSDDTVDFYISAVNNDEYDTYKTEFETEIQQVKVSVQELGAPEPPKPVTPEPKADPKAEKPGKPELRNDPKSEPEKPDPAGETPQPPEAPKPEEPAKVVKPAEKPRNSIVPAAPVNPPAPPAKPSDPPAAGKEQTPPDPLTEEPKKPDEKPDEKPEEPKKPDEIDKPDTEDRPDDSIPAPEKPEEQEGGKPALPDPDTEQAGEKDTEEKRPAEIHPVLPRPEPANGLLPKQDQTQNPEPPALSANA